MTSANLSDDEIEHVFKVFDANASGAIDRDEMSFALKALGWGKVTDDDVSQIFLEFDSTGNKTQMDQTEFAALVRSRQRDPDGPEEIHAAFRLFDADSKGRLSAADLKRVGELATGRPVPDDLVAEILRLADADGDGVLSFEEFRSAVAVDASGSPLESPLQSPTHAAKPAPALEDEPTDAEEAAPAAAGDAEPTTTELIANVAVTLTGGLILKAEARRAIAEMGYDSTTLPDASFDELFEECDGDGDARLTKDEYCALIDSFGETL
jgi:Ca2+-binding EF-hand superfamily protein